jgi:hypothetical protein
MFSPLAHPALAQLPLAQLPLAQGRMVCVAPRGMLPAALSARRVAALADLAPYPVIGLDVADPIGRSLSLACREADIGLQFGITVQTYHSALALAHHGPGIAIIDSCTAASADLARVEVLALDPLISVPVTALLPWDGPARWRCGPLCVASSRPWRQGLGAWQTLPSPARPQQANSFAHGVTAKMNGAAGPPIPTLPLHLVTSFQFGK